MHFIIVFLFFMMVGAEAEFHLTQSVPEQKAAKLKSGSTVRTHRVYFDTNALYQSTLGFDESGDIVIDVEKGKQVRARLKHFSGKRILQDFSWIGENIDSHGKTILSVKNGILVGSITLNGTSYKILPENEYYIIVKEDPSQAVKFGEDAVPIEKPASLPLFLLEALYESRRPLGC